MYIYILYFTDVLTLKRSSQNNRMIHENVEKLHKETIPQQQRKEEKEKRTGLCRANLLRQHLKSKWKTDLLIS